VKLASLLVDADDIQWQNKAACADQPLEDFVPDTECASGLQRAKELCDTCPVRQSCLMWATLYGAEGYWGGTNTYQRNQLRRVRTRAKCPLCLSTSLVYTDPHELCLACGVSWVRDVREQPIAATPLPQCAA
jgi:WhiB family redox-sensing transcriptional regulator